jgi:hypothetical protein
VTIRVIPSQGEAWIGTFAFGRIVPNGLSGVFTTPHRKRLLVVAKGDGYLITADNPERWERVVTVPTIDVRSIGKYRIIVLASFTHLAAYNDSGILWKTKQLSWDNLKVVSIKDHELRGEFWDIRTESTQQFLVDLKTGTASGGAALPEMKLGRQV